MKAPTFIAVVATMRMFSSPKWATRTLAAISIIPLISSCTIERGTDVHIPTSVEAASTRMPDKPVEPAPITQLELENIVTEIEAHTQTHIGVAVGEHVAGSVLTQVAWSTVKVPVAVAALRKNPTLAPTMYHAVTSSDNAAAQQLWESLGAGETAAQAVNQILREAGDMNTEIQPHVTRPSYSAFGQTYWSVADQVRFMEGLKDIPESQLVLDAMLDIVPDQRYGLGRLAHAKFKGGWGPLDDGTYLVRQCGLIPSPHGDVGIALLVRTHSDYEAGKNVMDQLAVRLNEKINPTANTP